MHWTFRWDILWVSFYTLRPPDIIESSWRRFYHQSNLIRRLCVGNVITLTRERTLYTSHLNHNENLILYLILQKRSYSRMQSIIIEPLDDEYCIINSVLHNLQRHVFFTDQRLVWTKALPAGAVKNWEWDIDILVMNIWNLSTVVTLAWTRRITFIAERNLNVVSNSFWGPIPFAWHLYAGCGVNILTILSIA